MPADDALVTEQPSAAQVAALAARVASRDAALRKRADLSPEDVAHDVVVQYLGLAEPPTHWKAWTRLATRNRLIDIAKQSRRRGELAALLEHRLERAAGGPSAQVMAGHQVQQALAVLTEKEQTVVLLHLTGRPHSEIADQLGYASAGVVSSLVHRAVGRIRSALPDLEHDLEPQRVYALGREIDVDVDVD